MKPLSLYFLSFSFRWGWTPSLNTSQDVLLFPEKPAAQHETFDGNYKGLMGEFHKLG